MSTEKSNRSERLRGLRERLENISQADLAPTPGFPWEAERINIRTGQIYMVTVPDGGSALKRLVLSEKGGKVKLICMSDNVAAYRPFEFELESRRPVHSYVIGRVRWVGKEID